MTINAFFLPRDFGDMPALNVGGEPFCRRAAYAWLWENARFAPGEVNSAGKTVHLERGQLCLSLRFLARAWGWSVAAVRRFLNRLETDTAIRVQTGTGQTVITICNYEEIRPHKGTTGTPKTPQPGTEAAQDRHKLELREQESKKGETYVSLVAGDADDGLPEPAPPGPEPEQLDMEDFLADTAPAVADESVAEPEPAAEPPKPPKGGRKPRTADFAEFYANYPKKGAMDRAEREYLAARKRGITHAQLMHSVGVLNAAIDAGRREVRFVPFAAKWIKEGYWRDVGDQCRDDDALPTGVFSNGRYHANRYEASRVVRGPEATLELAREWLS